jgi:hypothetical protein
MRSVMIPSARVTTLIADTPFAFTFGTGGVHGALRRLGLLAASHQADARDESKGDDAAAFDGTLIFHLSPLGQKYEGFLGIVPNSLLEI